MPSPNDDPRLKRYSLIVTLFDQLFRVPGTRWRFGLDALLGLIPGAGDLITGLVGSYGLVIAYQTGAPASIQLRMVLNLLIDTAVGSIPLLGDLFDFAFKAHVRNHRLLQGWLERPRQTRRSSVFVLIGALLVLFGSIIGAVWLVVVIVRALFRLFSGS